MILVFININEKCRLCRKLTDKSNIIPYIEKWPYLSNILQQNAEIGIRWYKMVAKIAS